MRRIARNIFIGVTAFAVAISPDPLDAEGPCEDLCVSAGVDLLRYANWAMEDVIVVVLSCVKGCSVP